MPSVSPYLNFSGDCENAFNFYQSVLGGELFISRFDEMPDDDSAPPVDDPSKIMHVSLALADGQVLMGSDVPPSMGSVTAGNNIHVSYSPEGSEEGKRVFDGLAEGGQVTMPYQRMFWGADYGMCTDRFGVHWMVNYQEEEWN